jgi:hypothetical protein
MTTVGFEPVYLVSVSVPLLVVKVNWACATPGSPSNSKKGPSCITESLA